MLRELNVGGRTLNITCFWESLPMPHVGTIVGKASASLAGYNAISIRASHRDMVRFNDAEDPHFLSVVGELRRWADDLADDPSVILKGGVSAEQLRKQQRTECLKSLSFGGLDSRRGNIESPNPKTCEWIFDHSCLKIWDRLDDIAMVNVLWIKGKPGSGKSTLMKSVTLDHERRGRDCLGFFL